MQPCDLEASDEKVETNFLTLKGHYISGFCDPTVLYKRVSVSFLHLFFVFFFTETKSLSLFLKAANRPVEIDIHLSHLLRISTPSTS